MEIKSLWPTLEEIMRPEEENPINIIEEQVKIGNRIFPEINARLEKGITKHVFRIGETNTYIFAVTKVKTEGWYPIVIETIGSKKLKINNHIELSNFLRDIFNKDWVKRRIRRIITIK